jgi:hypothetical protein
MTAVELVATLQARGVQFEPVGDRLRFRPGEVVTAEEREALRRHRGEVLRLLAPLALDPETVRTVVGPSHEPAVLTELEAEIRRAIAQYGVEISTGVIGRGVLTVRGRALADYLDLDALARLLTAGASP